MSWDSNSGLSEESGDGGKVASAPGAVGDKSNGVKL